MMSKPKCEQAQERTDFRDEHGQVTKVLCIIAPIECYSGYTCRYFHLKKVVLSMP